MSRRVIPAGDSLKDSIWVGREAWTESERPTVPTLYAPGRLMSILLCEGEFASESFICSRGTSLAPTPHNHDQELRIPLNSENFEDSVNSILLHHCSMIEPSMTKKKTILCPLCKGSLDVSFLFLFEAIGLTGSQLATYVSIRSFKNSNDREVLSLHADVDRKARFRSPVRPFRRRNALSGIMDFSSGKCAGQEARLSRSPNPEDRDPKQVWS